MWGGSEIRELLGGYCKFYVGNYDRLEIRRKFFLYCIFENIGLKKK